MAALCSETAEGTTKLRQIPNVLGGVHQQDHEHDQRRDSNTVPPAVTHRHYEDNQDAASIQIGCAFSEECKAERRSGCKNPDPAWISNDSKTIKRRPRKPIRLDNHVLGPRGLQHHFRDATNDQSRQDLYTNTEA